MSSVDVAIVGGGPAGLTAAGTLARQLHTAVVFDSGFYRNGDSAHLHTVPGWDQKDPREFRDTTRGQIESNYSTIQFVKDEITKIDKKSDSLFEVIDASGKAWTAKKIILASGSTDVLPDIPGYKDCWKKRIYHCLFCLGYEDRGAESSGVLTVQGSAMAGLVVHMADNAAQLSKNVTIYTNASEELLNQLKPLEAITPFKMDDRAITSLKNLVSSVEITFADGTAKTETFLVHNPLTVPSGPFAEQLNLARTPMGDIQAEAPYYQTSSRGVFAAGDAITPYKVVPHAICSGNFCAVAAAAQLQSEKYGHPSPF